MEAEISFQKVFEVRYFYGLILSFKGLSHRKAGGGRGRVKSTNAQVMHILLRDQTEGDFPAWCAFPAALIGNLHDAHLPPFQRKALTFVLTSRAQKSRFPTTSNTLSTFKVSALSLRLIAFYTSPPVLCPTAGDAGTSHTQSSSPSCCFHSGTCSSLDY